MGINSIYICIEDKEWLLSAKIELGWPSEATSFSGQRHLQRKRLLLHIYYLSRICQLICM